MTKPRISKAEARARRIGRPDVYYSEIRCRGYAWIWVGERAIKAQGCTRYEAIRNVLRVADRAAKQVERSKR